MNQPDGEWAPGACLSHSSVLSCLGFGCCTARQRKGEGSTEAWESHPDRGTPGVALDTPRDVSYNHVHIWRHTHAQSYRECTKTIALPARTGKYTALPGNISDAWKPGRLPFGIESRARAHSPVTPSPCRISLVLLPPEAFISDPSQRLRWASWGAIASTLQNC